MPTLVHGVDISTLEGWMVKINSNPSMFGKSLSRRWFRVSFVPAGNDQKLIISYSTSKTSKEPRGWLYIEDVSGVYCRRDMIEVVSPARTLRFKGETTVEHRLWSDSLHKLCNPPKPEETQEEKRLVAESTALHERQRERLRSQDRDRIADPKKSREYVDSSRETSDEAKPTVVARKSMADARSSPRDGADAPPPRRRASSPEKRDTHRRDRRHDSSDDEQDRRASSEEEEEEAAPLKRRQSQESPRERRVPDRTPANHSSKARQSESPRSARREDSPKRSPRAKDENDDSDHDERRRPRRDSDHSDDSDEEEEERPRRASAAPLERRPSLLVASIKSMSPVVSTPAQPKPMANSKPSESKTSPVQTREASPVKRDAKPANHSDDEEGDEEDPQKESPREQATPSPTPSPVKTKTKPKSTDYFDDDEEEEEETNNKRRPSIPMAQVPAQALKAAPVSEVRADNNFAEDDWDAEDPVPAPCSKEHEAARASPQKRASVGFGGVAADTNFATEDWD